MLYVGGWHDRAAAAADCHASGGRLFGQVTLSIAGIMHPAPGRAGEAATTRKGGGLRWFRLVVIMLILIGIVATLVKSAWSSHAAPEPTGHDARHPAP